MSRKTSNFNAQCCCKEIRFGAEWELFPIYGAYMHWHRSSYNTDDFVYSNKQFVLTIRVYILCGLDVMIAMMQSVHSKQLLSGANPSNER